MTDRKTYSNGKRAHRVTTGRGREGGARPGAGRPPGTPNVLPTGAIKAIKALNMRVPDKLTDTQREVLAETEEAVLKVMRGKVHGSIAGPVLKAATTVREEICGPIVKKIEMDAKLGLSGLLDEVAALEAEENKEAAQEPPPPEEKAPVVAKAPVIRKKT